MNKEKTIVIATHNKHKEKEIINLFSEMNLNILSLDHFPNIGEIEETGKTLLENSLLKAREVHQKTGLPALADDTGLEVDLLNGAPGVYSARYAGINVSYDDNINKLLLDLINYQNEIKRTARFKTVISYISDNAELIDSGIVEGIITLNKYGKNGFGYDPIFRPKNFNKTFAQMSQYEKSKISHRAIALKKIKDKLKKYIKKESV